MVSFIDNLLYVSAIRFPSKNSTVIVLLACLNSMYLLCEVAAVCMADEECGQWSRAERWQCQIQTPLCSAAADPAVSNRGYHTLFYFAVVGLNCD